VHTDDAEIFVQKEGDIPRLHVGGGQDSPSYGVEVLGRGRCNYPFVLKVSSPGISRKYRREGGTDRKAHRKIQAPSIFGTVTIMRFLSIIALLAATAAALPTEAAEGELNNIEASYRAPFKRAVG
jgi:hypothetical protein